MKKLLLLSVLFLSFSSYASIITENFTITNNTDHAIKATKFDNLSYGCLLTISPALPTIQAKSSTVVKFTYDSDRCLDFEDSMFDWTVIQGEYSYYILLNDRAQQSTCQIDNNTTIACSYGPQDGILPYYENYVSPGYSSVSPKMTIGKDYLTVEEYPTKTSKAF